MSIHMMGCLICNVVYLKHKYFILRNNQLYIFIFVSLSVSSPEDSPNTLYRLNVSRQH